MYIKVLREHGRNIVTNYFYLGVHKCYIRGVEHDLNSLFAIMLTRAIKSRNKVELRGWYSVL